MEGWSAPDRGVLFVVSGPSGAGKSTLIRAALDAIPGLSFSVSATTRAPRPGEADGTHYHFVTAVRFAALLAEDAFLEHATVYDRSYGTLRAPTEAVLARGGSLVLDVDVQGSAQIRRRFPDAVHVFVVPSTVADLEARLLARWSASEEVVSRRMDQGSEQLRAIGSFDYLVLNASLTTAHTVFQGILLAEMSRRARRQSWVDGVLRQLPGR